jgi:hypothetical protein
MPIKKRVKKQPGAAPATTAKQVFGAARPKRKRRPGRSRKRAEPVPIVAEVKSIMRRIFESQREQLFQLREDIQKVIFLGW